MARQQFDQVADQLAIGSDERERVIMSKRILADSGGFRPDTQG